MSDNSSSKKNNVDLASDPKSRLKIEKTTHSLDIFAPPSDPLTLEDLSSSWGKPLHNLHNKEQTLPVRPQKELGAPTTQSTVITKKIPTW